MSNSINIHFLNHASVRIDVGEVKLLTDPWFEGTAFGGGWGLKYLNSDAWERARDANFLWLSHFHQDHFHIPTLEKLLQVNPDIQVIANDSYNFKFSVRLKQLGFKKIISFKERVSYALSSSISICRYPATGIDNILVLKTPNFTIVNYNDCVLAPLTKHLLAKKIGPIDAFLVNFNHAGKLLHSPLPNPEFMKKQLCTAFLRNFAPFSPKLVLPFASYHYYRAQESVDQNKSLIEIDELCRLEERICEWSIGDHISFDTSNGRHKLHRAEKTPVAQIPSVIARNPSCQLKDLEAAAKKYCQILRNRWPILSLLMPSLIVSIEDLGVTKRLITRSGKLVDAPFEAAHISAHSTSLKDWWANRYGTDTFIVGAHFRLLKGGKRTIMFYILTGMLIDNALDLVALLRMVVSSSGLLFLFNRREEIFGILTSLNVAPEYQKDIIET